MRKDRAALLARLFVVLLAGAILVAPVVGIAHATEHHGAVDSDDCGTCHWSRHTADTVSGAPALAALPTVEVLCDPVPNQPYLRLRGSDQPPRGPPAARV